MVVDLSDEFVANVRTLAAKTIGYDDEDFDIYGWSGGQPDDAYSIGLDHGEVLFARDLISIIDGASE